MRRAICIKFIDGSSKILELSKATSICADIGMIHLDKLKNDTWRLTFSTDITDEFKNIHSFEMIREEVPAEQ
jgi:hypothetical protein